MPVPVEYKLPERPPLTPSLRPSGHQPEELVNMLVLHSRKRGSHLDSDQRNALKLFSKIPDHRRPKEEFITKFFFVFDELFFFRSLRKYCYIEYSDRDWRNKQYNGYSKIAGKGQIIIRMLAYEEAGNSLAIWWDYASTLLHEMVHAFLLRWSHPHLALLPKSLEGQGRTGHGFAWQDISFALESAANDPTLTGMKLDLDREFGLRVELREW